MNIIICGAGRVGYTIAKLLSEQGHSITVIDLSSEDIQKINDTLDVKVIVGKATNPLILEKANENNLLNKINIFRFGFKKNFIEAGSRDYIYKKHNLDFKSIYKRLKSLI